MKKKLVYIAAVLICFSLISGGTWAYFTAEDTAHNVITTNEVDIEIVREKLVNGSVKKDSGETIWIMPATTVSMIVSAKSIEASSWVRMNYEINIFDANGNKKDVSEQELDRMIQIETDESKWIEQDGWWYYKASLQQGETTMPLFEEITFSGPEMGNEYQNCTVELDICAQGVQKANNKENVMDAAGWPAK